MNTRTVLMTLVIVAAIGGLPWLIGCGDTSSHNMVAAPTGVGGTTIAGNIADFGQTYTGLDSVGLVVRLDNVPSDFAPIATILTSTGESKTLRRASLPGTGVFLAYDGLDLFTVASFSQIEFSVDLLPGAFVEILDRNIDDAAGITARASMYGYRRRLDVSGNGRVDTNDLALIQGWIQAGRGTDATINRLRALELYPALSGDPIFLPVVADDDLNSSGAIDSYDVALTMAWIQTGRVADAALIFNRAKEIFPAVTVAPGKFPGDPVALGITNYTTIDIGGGVQMTFAPISSATFLMGSGTSMHTVTITRPYNMSVTEVTQRQYQYIMGTNPANFSPNLDRPVEYVTWYDAIQFCNMLSLTKGLTQSYTASGSDWVFNYNANGFRLPTEAEWEYAARGVSAGVVFTPSATVDDYGWYSANSGNATHDVAQKLPNAFGLYDMLGNVWEWTWDWNAGYPTTWQTDPVGPDNGSLRVLRGGCWADSADKLTAAYRYYNYYYGSDYSNPNNQNNLVGFRVVRP